MQPRLGPKPFTPPKLNDGDSFNKVFCVPAVPGQQNNTSSNGVHETVNIEPQIATVEEKQPSPTIEIEPVVDESQCENGNNDNQEEIVTPKTPSTAERRKIFESNIKETDLEDNFDITDQSGVFERASVQRNSIAERRKMYERSKSVQETTNTIVEKSGGSPVMLRKKDSFKARNTEDSNKDENNRKSVPIAKQQSLDQQVGKKNDVTPTPKRTSTVFGKAKTK